MNGSGGSCGSPNTGSSAEGASEVFKEMWLKLKDCHDKEVQGLQMKINKLKKERCLDAQRLEEYYSKNQQLREHQKALHENIKVLEDRLRAGLCDRCAVTEEHMRKKQQEFENIRQQNLKLITELMNEKNNLQEENKKLSEQLQQRQKQSEALFSPCEYLVGVPKSGVAISPGTKLNQIARLHQVLVEQSLEKVIHNACKSELPVVSQCATTKLNHGKAEEVLVAETCELELSPIPSKLGKGGHPAKKATLNLAAVVMETVGLSIPEGSVSTGLISPLPASCFKIRPESTHNNPFTLPKNATTNTEVSLRMISAPTQMSTQNRDWISQQPLSPVFGVPTSHKNDPDLDKKRSPSLFSPRISTTLRIAPIVSTIGSNVPKASTKAEEVALISPLNFGPNGNDAREQKVSKQNSSDQHANVSKVTSTSPDQDEQVDNSEFILNLWKMPGSKWGKRKKTDEENDLLMKCEKTSFNKENDLPSKAEKHAAVNGDEVLDKPLDLSDRLSSARSHERNQGREVCKNRLKQATLQEAFRCAAKSSASFRKAFNGGCTLSKDSQNDLYLQEALQRSLTKTSQDGIMKMQKEVSSSFKVPLPTTGSMDTEQLFNDMKVAGVKEPTRKKTKEGQEQSEPASVLQPNPCAVTKPNILQKEEGKPSLQSLEDIQWSIDPGANLSQYKMDIMPVDSKHGAQIKHEVETVDMDNTFVNESVLLKMKNHEVKTKDNPGNEHKTTDSLAEMFDRTAYGEYESCPQDRSPSKVSDQESKLSSLKPEPITEKIKDQQDLKHKVLVEPYIRNDDRKNTTFHFPHVEVIRNKEERRRLHGHTCKECEIYYADLPEAERVQKLAACSRHRFRYIPPSTPENFWEVGFPSTQTCIDRGYIKEEMSPCQRPKRRRPYNAMFSPKAKEQKT
uniref:DNA endonuclease RBBP8 n=1 Tax=Latimeria chalumnae TaxID=7897 RepID=H3BE76_LATCH